VNDLSNGRVKQFDGEREVWIMMLMRIASVLCGLGLAVIPAAAADELSRLERQIRHELVMLPNYGVFDHLSFRLDQGKVVLSGQVSRPTLKQEAERVVQSVEGIREVENQIEVLPVSGQDDDIRLAVYRAIYGHTALNRYQIQAVPPIHIIVSNGNVTLEGVVANESDKNIANMQARSVPGVFSVNNNLQVEKDR
jgi:hyperosmotically inducible periplasmic protein